MPFGAPFKLGPFSVDGEGRLSPCEPSAVPAFLFRWRNRVVRARLGQADVRTGQLTVQVTLARISSSANTIDETLRPRSFALLHWLERTMPPAWRLTLLADHRVWLETDTRIDLPITATGLITEIACFTLALAPFVELMDQSGLTLSGAR